MRGEQHLATRQIATWSGSSPHARGAAIQSGIGSGCMWIIPACAGSSDYGDVIHTPDGDHPRMRGEQT